MEVTEEEWLTTGQAAKVAARDVRTIRRWVEDGRVKARVSPYGHRQIALSSLLEAQRPAGPRTRRRRRGGGRVLPPECLEQWASSVADWATWRPAPSTSEAELRSMLGYADELRDAVEELYETLADAIASGPTEGSTEGLDALDWLRSTPAPRPEDR